MKTLIFIILFCISLQAQTFCVMSGRVTDINGNGVYNATVTASTPFSANCGWQGATVKTSPFGYYGFAADTNCGTILINISHKDYSVFVPESYGFTFTVPQTEPVSNIDFVAVS